MTTCLRCGRTNRSIARFCIDCNTSLPGAVPEPDAEDAEFAEPGETRQESTTLAFGLAGAFTQTLVDPAAERRTRPTDHALPEGTMIEGFRIVRTIGEGGFGIVYLAWDAALERHVAIKEYMPSSLAVRSDAQYSVSVRSERYRDTFDAGLRSFVNEARLLARFDHPALVKVLRFWEANRTAYMAMPWYEGPTLKQTLAELKGRSTDEQLRAWLHPLLDALAVIHQENCFHRDISPDNILLTATGPVLLDFGAARRAINDMTQAMTAVLKPGFAPIEQYGGDMLQGPWTDLYALGGVVHYAITGRPPPASVLRAVEDKLEPLSASHAGRFSRDLLAAVDNALAVRPEARPQDVAAFRAMLGAPSPLPRASGTMVRPGAVAAD
ncbi:MAG: serine/threonine-protein kinase, partial [Variovorax sp.]